MKSKAYRLTFYIIVFMVCVWQSGGKVQQDLTGEYARQINKLSYQLDYYDTYSPVFSPYSIDDLQAVNTNETQEKKMIYLTFDDGPSPRTEEILDILKKYDIKATFFVIKTKDEYIPFMKRAVEEGHTIGVHSYSHKYNEIYRSVDAYLDDFTKCYNYIYDNTGYKPEIYRFPGGSVNNYNAATRRDIVAEMSRRGYIYFDWNVESNDSSRGKDATSIYNSVINGCKGKSRAIIIFHDSTSKKSTVQALENIIITLKEDGWQFAALDNEVKPVIFRMK
ncbi:MAG: polysaccharide deacetylase [Oscillospiraceae bacterium]|nr:polysaccharide deacetylase [Oscillospiraceae bacterium]